MIVAGIGIALLLPFLLGPLVYLGVALGLPPRIIPPAEWLAPLVGIAGGALLVGRGHRGWLAGLWLAAGLVLLWAVTWCIIMDGGNLLLWGREALPKLTGLHLLAWALALCTGALAGHASNRLAMRPRGIAQGIGGLCCVFLFVPLITACFTARPATGTLAPGVTVRQEPFTPDGTALTLVTADLAKNPRLTVGVYDCDLDDVNPGDDHNATWLPMSLPFALPRIRAQAHRQGETVLCACNGDFFYNLIWRGSHLVPIVVNGQAYYNVHGLFSREQDWQLGFRREGGRLRFVLEHDFSWPRWQTEFETALGGVRPLRVAGESLELKPGNGNTRLRCARTSLGWSADSSHCYLLIVEDLDGEGPGMIQKKRDPQRQTGGFDMRQLQQYWERLGVPNAVVFDGGDSTQFVYHANGADHFLHSGYLLSTTLGYLNQRPIRLFAPLLPPQFDHVGVMNYLYLAERDR